ncbi:Het-C-domain-containing protein [Aureobasidium subglaciale]|nr:Het-C-domain-containing protein [Aureobasidium subglaciale]
MAIFSVSGSSFAVTTVFLLFLLHARPTHAFGAGNIASVSNVEGVNFRHGDIEDTLLTLVSSYAYAKGAKFSKIDVKRVYFGNWLRDYSQAVDVGTTKHVSAEAIRILLWVLGFLTFGYGTGEFEVTTERLGCYRPEEHIDNPKDYADNEDARQYDRRLRAPVDEERELSIDERTGLKNYIASEDVGITTSAQMVRNLFGRCIDLGRSYNRSRDKKEFYEALRLLGTACHCLEDYSAHSNYTELALIELGERDIFPHVGRNTQVRVQGARHQVYPIVTGTFGGVDFLHSVMGELDDKATQSEIQELEGVIDSSQNQNTSLLKKLLKMLPSGLLGGKDQAGKVDELQSNAAAAQMGNMKLSPRQPEEWAQQLQEVQNQIYPILQFHDELMMGINEAIEKIPILPDLLEQFTEQLNIFVFSLLAPFVLPIISQVKEELATGSSEVIQSSRDKQLIVFHDDNSSDPTHSMLSKDHFSNILNEPAGKIGCAVLKWVVPQIVQCWDNENVDIARTLDRIINGVFHHPALRQVGNDGAADGRHIMFGVVEQWWQEKSERERDDLRRKLSRRGVETGQNHKEGVQDSGHGCCKPLFQQNQNNNAPAAAAHAAVMEGISDFVSGGQSSQHNSYGNQGRPSSRPTSAFEQQAGNFVGEAVGGGALGSVLGGLVGSVGGSLLSGAFESQGQTQTFQQSSHNQDGSYTQSYMQTGERPSSRPYGQEQTAQAEYKTTQYPGGGHRTEYNSYEQEGNSGHGYQQSTEVRPTQGGGYEQRTERRHEQPGGRWQSEVQQQSVGAAGEYYQTEEKHHGRRNDDDDDDDERRSHRKHGSNHRNDYESEQQSYSRPDNSGGFPGASYHAQHQERHDERPSYGQERPGYGNDNFGGRNEFERPQQYGRDEGFGRQEYGRGDNNNNYGRQGHGRRDEDEMPGGFPDDDDQERRHHGGRREGGNGYGGGNEGLSVVLFYES